MRKLSNTFMHVLKSGFLAGITAKVRNDKDLDLQIRDNYLNLYFKGNSLLKLTEIDDGKKYRVEIDDKFKEGLNIPQIIADEGKANNFLGKIPALKEKIIEHGKSSLEIEYEQMLIRANNNESRNNSEYFIIDRQYAAGNVGRFDLVGFFWPRNKRRKKQEVPLCFMEVKFALNPDIKNVHEQLARYYDAIRKNPADFATEAQTMFRQKLELGLFDQDESRIEAMKTLTFSPDIERFQFILVLVDYNQNSSLFDRDSLLALPFSKQIKIFKCGFAMWQQNVRAIS